MKKLLVPAAEIMSMDATDFSDGDRLLKEMGKDVSRIGRATAFFGVVNCSASIGLFFAIRYDKINNSIKYDSVVRSARCEEGT